LLRKKVKRNQKAVKIFCYLIQKIIWKSFPKSEKSFKLTSQKKVDWALEQREKKRLTIFKENKTNRLIVIYYLEDYSWRPEVKLLTFVQWSAFSIYLR